MDVDITPYGTTRDGEPVHRLHLAGGIDVRLLTYGGIVERLDVADAAGRRANVVLGLPDLATYEARNPNFGATVGRYAGRIAGGRFALDGRSFRLTQNEGGNTLHGGRGWAKRVWQIAETSAGSATLSYRSADGEEGFPGALETRVTFTVEGRTLRLQYSATTDAPTVVNLTNHSYFNLAGEGSGDVMDHVLQIEAERFLQADADSLPTGTLLDVTGTPFDFRTPHAVGARIRDSHPQIVHGLGYDACYVLRGAASTAAGPRHAARLLDPASGRAMTVRTDQPAVQLYTANKLTGALVGLSGRTARAGDGLCLETQHFPDAPNRPAFPSTVLRPGSMFRSTTEYVFD